MRRARWGSVRTARRWRTISQVTSFTPARRSLARAAAALLQRPCSIDSASAKGLTRRPTASASRSCGRSTRRKHQLGRVFHTIGWPLDTSTYGGSFLYHRGQSGRWFCDRPRLHQPHLSPLRSFNAQDASDRSPDFRGWSGVSPTARAINEGGLQSVPSLPFPGGVLVGCAAGFLNVPKIKGSHTAMKSGMLAAEAVFELLGEEDGPAEAKAYERALKASWVWDELRPVRNIRPSFRWGLWGGLIYSAIDTYIFRGRAPWTLRQHSDHDRLRKATDAPRIEYPKPDNEVSFDRLSSVFILNTKSRGESAHPSQAGRSVKAISINLELFDAPEQRYCPAGVYEIVLRRRRLETAAAKSTPRIAFTAKPVTSRTRPRTSNWVVSRRRRRVELPQYVTGLVSMIAELWSRVRHLAFKCSW